MRIDDDKMGWRKFFGGNAVTYVRSTNIAAQPTARLVV